ncbi:MAG: hypothetical protein JXR73_08240 [Candidatus Omnitrophica bacterium]|nr:hypothetical protein [Candidatus Omnitrophota bacterium]
MENLIELFAFLLFIILTGASAASKKAREKQKKYESEKTGESPIPPYKPRSKQPPQTTFGQEKPFWEQPQKQVPARKPLKRRQPQERHLEPEGEPFPRPAAQGPAWARMLREMLELEEPKPAPAPETPPPPKQPAKVFQKKEETPLSQTTKPAKLPRYKDFRKSAGARPLPSALNAIFERGRREPLRSAILLSEIIQPPRAKRRQIRSL